MDRNRMLEVAAFGLGVAVKDLDQCVRDLPEDQAIYAWTPGRGGSAVIVGVDGGILYANSSVNFDDHLAAYRSGRRTDPSLFES